MSIGNVHSIVARYVTSSNPTGCLPFARALVWCATVWSCVTYLLSTNPPYAAAVAFCKRKLHLSLYCVCGKWWHCILSPVATVFFSIDLYIYRCLSIVIYISPSRDAFSFRFLLMIRRIQDDLDEVPFFSVRNICNDRASPCYLPLATYIEWVSGAYKKRCEGIAGQCSVNSSSRPAES